MQSMTQETANDRCVVGVALQTNNVSSFWCAIICFALTEQESGGLGFTRTCLLLSIYIFLCVLKFCAPNRVLYKDMYQKRWMRCYEIGLVSPKLDENDYQGRIPDACEGMPGMAPKV